MSENNKSLVVSVNEQLNIQLKDPKVMSALLATTFKGLSADSAKQAMFEGMLRGFVFEDFLQKNVYAIPFKNSYSLITSIDYVRKIAMRSGLAGKSEPKFVENNNQIVSCTVTVKRNVDGVVGEYTATVFFSEYTTGNNLWKSKPHTMIAKVAEVHALRSAFPEEMSQTYVEEEMEKEVKAVTPEINTDEYRTRLANTTSKEELGKVWVGIPAKAKVALKEYKDELKQAYENPKVQEQGGVATS